MATDYAATAEQYALDVDHGRQIAGRWVQLACRRHLDNLEQAKSDPSYPFYFDPGAAGRPCKFLELMPHIKGQWARNRQLIRLQPWQVFSVATPFGWLEKETDTRRFVTIYEEVARKNAKSTKAAGLALYMLSQDDEPGAEVISAATKKEQAKIVLDAARAMAKRSTEFRLRFGVEVLAHAINQPASLSTFKALDAEAKTQDGWSVSCAINDEVHAWPKRTLYDVIDTATGSRDQPMIINITTAGTNRAGVPDFKVSSTYLGIYTSPTH